MKVKYLGTYDGPSYSGALDGSLEAFTSLDDAKSSMLNRQRAGYDYVTTFQPNEDGWHVMWEDGRRYDFPSATPSDYMDLYTVIERENGQLERSSDSRYRLTIGERGGVNVERS